MEETFVNKVAESGIISIDLEAYLPKKEIVVFDLKAFLFMQLILKEKDFREALKNIDWNIYKDKNVAVTCSADAIIPVWAYMLVAAYLQPFAAAVIVGNAADLKQQLLLENIAAIDNTLFTDKRVVIKGCGDEPIGEAAYLAITNKLRPVVKSIMYGEPCSTVPIYKKSNK
jgi:hypothetical protein